MKKFRFRLEKVLQYREMLKDEKRRELLKRNQELREARQRLEDLEKAALSNTLGQGQIMTVEQVYLAGLFAERVKEDIIKQRLAIIKAEEEVEKAMGEYVEASKDARSLEMLKERKLQEYMDYMHKEDEKFLDELAVQRGTQAK